MSGIDPIDQLRHAIVTAMNDDITEVGTEKRKRHCDRLDAMSFAIDEIERLRGVLATANNSWRHEFERDVSEATERLFKQLSARSTRPFSPAQRS